MAGPRRWQPRRRSRLIVGLGALLAVAAIDIPSEAGTISTSGCQAGSWRAEYFNNRTLSGAPAAVRCESAINHRWRLDAPLAGVSPNQFSVRWTMSEDFTAGLYRFTTVSDDGIRVRLDPSTSGAVTLVNHWNDHNTATDTAQATLAPGSHTVVVEYYENIGWATAKVSLVAEPTPQPGPPTPNPPGPSPSAPTPGQPGPTPSGSARTPFTGVTPVNGYWWTDYSDVPLGSAGCSYASGTSTANVLRKHWDYWDNCGASVVSDASEGLPPAPWGGDRIVKWYKPLGDPHPYQKLNKTFTRENWPGGGAFTPVSGSPADVSARYIVYQYVPSARFHLNPRHDWVILSEFKENYNDANGTFRQDPLWGLGCNNLTGSERCGLSPNALSFSLKDVTDRWVKWEYRLYQGAKDTTGHGGRIELYIDDRLIDTGYESRMHVGSAGFSPLSHTRSWVWIVGQYTSTQTTNGVPDYQNTDVTSYVGWSGVLPLP